MNKEIIKVLHSYIFKDNIESITTIDTGIINHTFLIKCHDGTKYILQKINTQVFSEPHVLMNNIAGVTNFIKDYYQKNNITDKQVLEVIPTTSNQNLAITTNDMGEKSYYRVYNYIKNAVTYDQSQEKEIVYNTGCAYGNFQRLLADYPMEDLVETIKGFHHTPNRFQALMEAVKRDPMKRSEEVAKEIVYFLQRENDFNLVMQALENGSIPYRVTHNDTKVNNVMMDKTTGNYIAVIDLDTVMPGSSLFDYGDAIRSVCATALEDEKDLSKVSFNNELLYYFTKGYLEETKLTGMELQMLYKAPELITNELAMRFLSDYINGDTYFKTNFLKHNLVRARNQIKLAQEFANNETNTQQLIKTLTVK